MQQPILPNLLCCQALEVQKYVCVPSASHLWQTWLLHNSGSYHGEKIFCHFIRLRMRLSSILPRVCIFFLTEKSKTDIAHTFQLRNTLLDVIQDRIQEFPFDMPTRFLCCDIWGLRSDHETKGWRLRPVRLQTLPGGRYGHEARHASRYGLHW